QRRSSAWMGVEGNGLRSSLGQRVERLLHLRGTTCLAQGRLRVTLARTLGPAALAATAILSTAWIGPQAFTKGEPMKTMKQTWKRSLAAFALLTTLRTEHPVALAANDDPQAGKKDPTRAAANSTAAAEKRIAVDPVANPAIEAPQDLY